MNLLKRSRKGMLMRNFRTTNGGSGFRNSFATAAAIIATALAMAMTPTEAHADETDCTEMGSSASPDSRGNSLYHLLPDCTLHIGKGTIATATYRAPVHQNLDVKSIIIDDPAETRFADDASQIFFWYPNTNSITGLEHMDASNVTRSRRMFAGLRYLKTPFDLSSWDMSKDADMGYMFDGANLDMIKGYGRFRLNSGSIDLSNMFAHSTTTGSIDLSGWHIGDSTTVSAMNSMFESAVAPGGISIQGDVAKKGARMNIRMFTGVRTGRIEGLDRLNMSRSISSEYMFQNAILSGPMDLSGWDMSSIVNTRFMFNRFDPPNDLDMSNWDMRGNKSTESMFQASDIDRMKGIDRWDLSHVEDASSMYAQIHPSQPLRIPENMRGMVKTTSMFEDSDLDSITNLADLRTSSVITTAPWMFRNAKRTYLDMSRWGFHALDSSNMLGMLGSPDIKYIKFGDMFKDSTKNLNSRLFYGGTSKQPESIWGRLPSYNATKRWTRLPYNDKDGRFDGTLESLGAGSGWIDQTMWWESPHTGEDADNDLKSIISNPGSIIFREATRPVRFHGNTAKPVTGMPSMIASTWASTIDGDRAPCNAIPTDSTGSSRFREWNTNPDGTGAAYRPCDQLDHGVEAMDLYAQWDEARKVPVRYHDQSGQAAGMPADAEQFEGNRYSIPGAAPQRYGYRFCGWATTDGGEPAYQPGDSITIGDVEGMDLYPVWKLSGASILPAAGLPAGNAPIVMAVVSLLLITMSAAIIGRRRRT